MKSFSHRPSPPRDAFACAESAVESAAAPAVESAAAPAVESADASSFAARIGHRFRDRSLLRLALTHRSLGDCGADSNERLEHLGDSVLGLVVAEALFARFPDADEGALSRMRAKLVSNQALAEQARALGVPAQVRLGASAQGTG
ncbi:MAG: ribonuclease III family protein, partial [bacterium]